MKLINDTDVLLDAFGLTKTMASDTINSWTTSTSTLSDIETYLLDTIHAKSMYHVSGWNEEEIKMKLISIDTRQIVFILRKLKELILNR